MKCEAEERIEELLSVLLLGRHTSADRAEYRELTAVIADNDEDGPLVAVTIEAGPEPLPEEQGVEFEVGTMEDAAWHFALAVGYEDGCAYAQILVSAWSAMEDHLDSI